MTNLISPSTGYSTLEDLAAAIPPTRMESWVNGTTGDDDNVGTESSPFATIEKAISVLPKQIEGLARIHVAAGTYEPVSNGFILNNTYRDGRLQIDGAMALATLATGSNTGTFTGQGVANDKYYLEMSGSTWTADDLLGKFVCLTYSGITYYFPIVQNTSTRVYIPCDFSASYSTSAFTIVEPSVKIKLTYKGLINSVSTINDALLLSKTGDSNSNGEDISVLNNMVNFRHIYFEGPDDYMCNVSVDRGAAARFYECKFGTKTAWWDASIYCHGRTYVYFCSFNSQYGIDLNDGALLFVFNTVFIPVDPDTKLIEPGEAALNFTFGKSFAVVSTCYFRSWNSTYDKSGAIMVRNLADGSLCFVGPGNADTTLDDCGFYINGKLRVNSVKLIYPVYAAVLNIRHPTIGIECDSYGRLEANFYESMKMTQVVNTGIQFESPYNSIFFTTNTVITGSTDPGDSPAWAVNLSGVSSVDGSSNGKFNLVHFKSDFGTDLSGFDTGTMTVDGSSDTTIASLLLDPDKIVSDSARFNVLSITSDD